jgi:hypothetical protein
MSAQYFLGEVIVSELVEEHLEEVEKLTENESAVSAVPEELQLGESEA